MFTQCVDCPWDLCVQAQQCRKRVEFRSGGRPVQVAPGAALMAYHRRIAEEANRPTKKRT